MAGKYHINVTVKSDPFIGRMARHSAAMPAFRERMAQLMAAGQAYVFKNAGGYVTLHPSDELLDAFYAHMGLE